MRQRCRSCTGAVRELYGSCAGVVRELVGSCTVLLDGFRRGAARQAAAAMCAGVPLSRVVAVGDSLTHDIAGAAGAGRGAPLSRAAGRNSAERRPGLPSIDTGPILPWFASTVVQSTKWQSTMVHMALCPAPDVRGSE